MTVRGQKTLAIFAAIAVVVIFAAANVHLLIVAVDSQPECRAVSAAAPAKNAC